MRNLFGILVTLILAFVGVGIVRPQTLQKIDEAWEPVAHDRIEVKLEDGASIELNDLGDYVLWMEGPASDAQWDSAAQTYVQLIDSSTRLPIASSRVGIDFEYERGDRRAVALSRVSVLRSGFYDLSFGRVDPDALGARGFKLALNSAQQVTDQSRQATWCMIGGIAVGVVMGIVALWMLSRKPA